MTPGGERARRLAIAAATCALLAGVGVVPGARAESWVDLTHPLSDETLYWPTGTPFELEVLERSADEHGRWYAASRFRAPEHFGTHLDAPFHFDQNGWQSDQIPLERMSGPALVVDVSAAAAAEWLARRGVAAVGIDTASIDPSPSRAFDAHRAVARVSR